MRQGQIPYRDTPSLNSALVSLGSLKLSNARLASAALLIALLPIAVFGVRLSTVPAAALLLGSLLSAYLIVSAKATGAVLSSPIDWRMLAGCGALSLALCLLGGEGHFFFSPYDWFTRDAVLADLVGNKYPVFYNYHGADYLLRAPLGMYMTPALLGWGFGLRTAHYALLAQNAFLLTIVLYLAASLAAGPKPRFLLLLLLFSPVDVIPQLFVSLSEYLQSGSFVIDPHFMFWNPLLKYWGQIPSLFWAPNHTLAAWLFAVLLLLNVRGEIDAALLALSSLILLFWSPLAMIGAAPYLALCGIKSISREPFSARNAAAAAAAILLLPLVFYLTMDAGAVTREWMAGRPGFWICYLLLLVFALPQAWILLSAWASVPRWQKGVLGFTILLLVVMPFFRLGVTVNDNDVTMRCTLAPLFLLAFGFSESAPAILGGRKPLAFATVAVIALSSLTGFMEIRRGLSDPPYEINDCNFVTATEKITPGFPASNYLAHTSKLPSWFVQDAGVRLKVERRHCWPGYPFTRKEDSLNDDARLAQ
jgi:hypothetical protein